MVFEVGLVLEPAATAIDRAVPSQLGHVVNQRVEEVSQLRDLNELLLSSDLLVFK